VLRDVLSEPGRRGSLVALFVGLALFAAAHVIDCALLHAPDGHHNPAAVSAQSAHHVVDCLADGPAHGLDLGGGEDCCGHAGHACDGPVRTQPLSWLMLLLGLAALGAAMPHAELVPSHVASRSSAAPPPRPGALLQLACVSRT